MDSYIHFYLLTILWCLMEDCQTNLINYHIFIAIHLYFNLRFANNINDQNFQN